MAEKMLRNLMLASVSHYEILEGGRVRKSGDVFYNTHEWVVQACLVGYMYFYIKKHLLEHGRKNAEKLNVSKCQPL